MRIRRRTGRMSILDLDAVVMAWAWDRFHQMETQCQRALSKHNERRIDTDDEGDGQCLLSCYRCGGCSSSVGTSSSCRERCSGKRIDVQIDWSAVEFTNKTHWSSLLQDNDDNERTVKTSDRRPDRVDEATSSTPAASTASKGQTADDAPIRVADTSPLTSVLFHTKFTNDTTREQQYQFRTERTTKSTLTTSITTSNTKSLEAGLSLKTPNDILSANVGVQRAFTLSNGRGQTFEDDLTWSVDTTIGVDAGTEVDARFVVYDRRQRAEFVVRTRLRGPVLVMFVDARKRKKEAVLRRLAGVEIAAIIHDYLEKSQKEQAKSIVKVRPVNEGSEEGGGGDDERGDGTGGVAVRRVAADFVSVNRAGKEATIETHGTFRFCYCIKQEIQLHQNAIAKLN